MREVREVGSGTASRVQLREAERGRSAGAVCQRLERRVADVDRVLDRLLPVSVFVADRREYLVAVVAVHVADVRPEDTISTRIVISIIKIEGFLQLKHEQHKKFVYTPMFFFESMPYIFFTKKLITLRGCDYDRQRALQKHVAGMKGLAGRSLGLVSLGRDRGRPAG